MTSKYIGIENELITFKKGKKKVFSINYFNKLADSFDDIYYISEKSIRTGIGNGYYIDGSELEILTPPIALNKGFSSRLTNSLIIGRNKLIKALPDLEYTGFSMHWNLTNDLVSPKLNDFYETIAIPFQLFGLTPISWGFNLRDKVNRYEILGDSLKNKEQINATALLLGASLYALEEEKFQKSPFKLVDYSFRFKEKKRIFIQNGRYDYINVNIESLNWRGNLQVQQYLELFYQWIKPHVKRLGTKDEIKNLEAFIKREKKLEFDKFKYYAFLKENNAKINGSYLPLKTLDNIDLILKEDKSINKISLEGLLLGELIKKKSKQIKEILWDRLALIENDKKYIISGIDNIYEYASLLDKNLPRFKRSKSFRKFNSLDKIKLDKILSNNLIVYNLNEENFREMDLLKEYLKFEFKKVKPLKLFKNLLIFSAITYSILFSGLKIYNYYSVKNQIKTLIKESNLNKNG